MIDKANNPNNPSYGTLLQRFSTVESSDRAENWDSLLRAEMLVISNENPLSMEPLEFIHSVLSQIDKLAQLIEFSKQIFNINYSLYANKTVYLNRICQPFSNPDNSSAHDWNDLFHKLSTVEGIIRDVKFMANKLVGNDNPNKQVFIDYLAAMGKFITAATSRAFIPDNLNEKSHLKIFSI